MSVELANETSAINNTTNIIAVYYKCFSPKKKGNSCWKYD